MIEAETDRWRKSAAAALVCFSGGAGSDLVGAAAALLWVLCSPVKS